MALGSELRPGYSISRVPEPRMGMLPGPNAQLSSDVAPALGLNALRLASVCATLRDSGARSVVDLGCGAGRLLQLLIQEDQFERLVGVDVRHDSLRVAFERLCSQAEAATKPGRVRFIKETILTKDRRFLGFEAATCVEVIEHLELSELKKLEEVIFQFSRPNLVVITTPNREYNCKWKSLRRGALRHRDHRFEWSRREFEAWLCGVAARSAYSISVYPVGPEDSQFGSPTQMAICHRPI